MTRYLADVASYQGALSVGDLERAGFSIVNLKISHGLTQRTVHPDIAGWVSRSRAAGLGISTFHYATGEVTGRAQAAYAFERLSALGLTVGTAHVLDVETNPVGPDATSAIVREYVTTMQSLLERPIMIYTGDWWWVPKGWTAGDLTPYLHAAPNAGYLGSYPGDDSPHWVAGYGGWPDLAAMQYAVGPLTFPDGSTGKINVSKTAVRSDAVWSALTGGVPAMAMDPRTHPRGAPPNFSMTGLPANPNPQRITDALWWLVQMRLRLEPLSANGGILAIKPGYHSYGSRLPDEGEGNSGTDHSIRRAPDRTGKWWKDFASAHDWTFNRAHSGNYTEINKYSIRLRNAMRDPKDLRPDDVYAYFIGQIDTDKTVEGYNEYRDDEETGDSSHLWHRHDSFRRNIIGDFWAMWKALTIDMGWTYAEWQRSTQKERTDMPLDNSDKTWLKSAEFTGAVSAAVTAALTKPAPLNGPDGKPDGTSTYPLGRAWDQGIPSVFNGGKRVPAWRLAGQSAEALSALAASVAAARAENATLEAGTKALVETLLNLITEGGGSPEVGAVLARLDAVEAEIVQAANRAGDAAADAVMDTMRRAAMAEVAVLQDPAEGLDDAVRANPPKE